MKACSWCHGPATAAQTFCSRKCRQAAWRLRGRSAVARDVVADGPGRFAYADPPYPGLARRYYQHEDSYAGEVDHAKLIASLLQQRFTGWALSTSAAALRDVLPLCPPGARVCAWGKYGGVSSRSAGLHNRWEPLIVVGGRQRPPGVRDWLQAAPARGGGSKLMGRKPLAFCAWLFDCLGMAIGDDLVDIFPGSGVVGRAWSELSRWTSATASPTAAASSSPAARGDSDGPSSFLEERRRFLPLARVAR